MIKGELEDLLGRNLMNITSEHGVWLTNWRSDNQEGDSQGKTIEEALLNLAIRLNLYTPPQ